jgi:hypothetical protein
MDMLEISPQLLREAKLSVNDMATYLTEHGWQKVANQNPRVMIFQGINDDLGNPIVLTLPRNDSFGDALRRLSEAVNLVAFLEDRSPESVLVDLRDRESSNQLSIDN